MRIAIHHTPGTFSDRWIEYCDKFHIEYKLVDAYANDIIDQISDCSGFMWRWHHNDYRDQLFARQLILSLESQGMAVFPDANTSWHYDDKLGQKYLLESVNAPLVNTYVFYRKAEALAWAKDTDYPKVFKLRGGAGSQNVRLVKSYSAAKQLIHKAFGRGFPVIDHHALYRDAIWNYKREGGVKNLLRIIKRILTMYTISQNEKMKQSQPGYIYFQEFIPNNTYDDRLVVIGNRCFCLRRYCRKNDFRASGSGLIEYKKELFPKSSIAIAFQTAKLLKSQSIAFDFVYLNNEPKIVEVSYAYAMGSVYDKCNGYWDDKLEWHGESVNPQYFMIEDFVESIKGRVIKQ